MMEQQYVFTYLGDIQHSCQTNLWTVPLDLMCQGWKILEWEITSINFARLDFLATNNTRWTSKSKLESTKDVRTHSINTTVPSWSIHIYVKVFSWTKTPGTIYDLQGKKIITIKIQQVLCPPNTSIIIYSIIKSRKT